MKRALRIIWCIIVPLALTFGTIFVFQNTFDDNPIKTILIFLGICIALNLPMFFAAIIEDAGDNRIGTFFMMVIFAPIWLIWNWFMTIKDLIQGGSGIDW